jgi:shikimate kinase
MQLSKRIILIGFKHVGKSTVGKALAQALACPFVDCDQVVETTFLEEHGQALSCREIVQQHGDPFFRALEHQVLKQLLQDISPCVLALGGGTPIPEVNQDLLRSEYRVHITLPREQAFERILKGGRPAFLPPDQEMAVALKELWEKRMPLYEKLASCTISNAGNVDQAVQQFLNNKM